MFLTRIRTFSILFLLLCVSFCFSISAQTNQSDSSNWGKLHLATWADDRQSAFSFSFDDGFISQYYHVKNTLDQYNFTATYFLLPPFLSDTLPGIWRYGTWPMFLEMYEEGYELASHSLNHPDLTQLPAGDTLTPNTIHYELYHSKKMINDRINSNECISFAYPFAENNPLVDSIAGLYYESSREAGGIPNPHSIIGSDWFRLKSYQVEFDLPRDSLENDLYELFTFIEWIDNSIIAGTWGIQLAHEVVPFSELDSLIAQGAYHPISTEWLILLCDWLKDKSDANEIWIETIGNVTKYIKERDSFSYEIMTMSNSLIEIDVTDTLDNEIYNYPLSVYISIPEDWDFVLVEQGSESKVLESFHADSMKLILANVTPDAGIIRLTNFNPNYVAEEDNKPEGFVLYQNYPNPFNPSTKIKFRTAKGGNVTLKVYDILGNEVATLVNKELPAGEYEVEFNSHSNLIRNLPSGWQGLSSGLYIYKLQTASFIETKKMILLK
jgi:peptidoglycan/xylan/chitin deacetylase (PgdA/CDA1 family)